jgi:hypothetical protein
LGTREAFAALDGEAGPTTTGWTHAGARSAEAGFEDPALGWIGVRADLATGTVHAAVVPGSAEAAQALGIHMTGLHTYLNEQRTPVDTLTLASPGNRSGDSGLNQGMQQGGEQSAGYGGSAGSRSDTQRGASAISMPSSAGTSLRNSPIQDSLIHNPLQNGGPGGTVRPGGQTAMYISVVA